MGGRSSTSQIPRDKAQTETPLLLDPLLSVAFDAWPTVQSSSRRGLRAAGGGLLLLALCLVKGGVGPAMLSLLLCLPGVCSET